MRTHTNMTINKYIAFYHKRNFDLALICAIIGFIPLFIVSLIDISASLPINSLLYLL